MKKNHSVRRLESCANAFTDYSRGKKKKKEKNQSTTRFVLLTRDAIKLHCEACTNVYIGNNDLCSRLYFDWLSPFIWAVCPLIKMINRGSTCTRSLNFFMANQF